MWFPIKWVVSNILIIIHETTSGDVMSIRFSSEENWKVWWLLFNYWFRSNTYWFLIGSGINWLLIYMVCIKAGSHFSITSGCGVFLSFSERKKIEFEIKNYYYTSYTYICSYIYLLGIFNLVIIFFSLSNVINKFNKDMVIYYQNGQWVLKLGWNYLQHFHKHMTKESPLYHRHPKYAYFHF